MFAGNRLISILAQGTASFLLGFCLFTSSALHAGLLSKARLKLEKSIRDCEWRLSSREITNKSHLLVSQSIPGYYGLSQSSASSEYREYDAEVFRRAQIKLDGLGLMHPPEPGVVLDKLIMVTHQMEEMQAATAKLLSQPLYQSIPSLMLVSPRFPIIDKHLGRKAAFFQISKSGELSRPIVAREVIFMGGFSAYCLANSVRKMIEAAEEQGMQEITLRFLPEYIYDSEGVGHRSLIQFVQLGRATSQAFFTNMNEDLMRFIVNKLTSEPNSFQKTRQTLAGRYVMRNSNLKINVIVDSQVDSL